MVYDDNAWLRGPSEASVAIFAHHQVAASTSRSEMPQLLSAFVLSSRERWEASRSMPLLYS